MKLIYVWNIVFSVGTEEDKAQESTGAMEKQECVNGDDIRTVQEATKTPVYPLNINISLKE